MKCPFCGHEQDKVVDSRTSREGRAVRRRRECIQCEKRFTTYEYIETFPLIVIKNDQRREPYDRQKLLHGITAACKKRPISIKKIESIVDAIEDDLEKSSKTEIDSRKIGNMVMDALKHLDDVAYVRFASVYRKFQAREEFINEIRELDSEHSE